MGMDNIPCKSRVKDTVHYLRSRLSLISTHDFLEPKKIRSFIADVRSACDKPCYWDVLALEELIMSVSSFGKKLTLCGMFPWFKKLMAHWLVVYSALL